MLTGRERFLRDGDARARRLEMGRASLEDHLFVYHGFSSLDGALTIAGLDEEHARIVVHLHEDCDQAAEIKMAIMAGERRMPWRE